ncbi:hypothetical protein D9M72_606200 [compost metagenome]
MHSPIETNRRDAPARSASLQRKVHIAFPDPDGQPPEILDHLLFGVAKCHAGVLRIGRKDQEETAALAQGCFRIEGRDRDQPIAVGPVDAQDPEIDRLA